MEGVVSLALQAWVSAPENQTHMRCRHGNNALEYFGKPDLRTRHDMWAKKSSMISIPDTVPVYLATGRHPPLITHTSVKHMALSIHL